MASRSKRQRPQWISMTLRPTGPHLGKASGFAGSRPLEGASKSSQCRRGRPCPSPSRCLALEPRASGDQEPIEAELANVPVLRRRNMGAGVGGSSFRSTALWVPLNTKTSSGRRLCFRSEWISVRHSRKLASPDPMKTRTAGSPMVAGRGLVPIDRAPEPVLEGRAGRGSRRAARRGWCPASGAAGRPAWSCPSASRP